MTIVTDYIAAELALLTRIVEVPEEPFGYGTDLSCVNDIKETLDEVDPFSVLGIGEALLRRFQTPRGGLVDDLDYGLDLRMYLNKGITDNQLTQVAGQIKGEATKDDRVDDVEVTVTLPAYAKMKVVIRVTPADVNLGVFDLVFAVTDGDVVLEAIR